MSKSEKQEQGPPKGTEVPQPLAAIAATVVQKVDEVGGSILAAAADGLDDLAAYAMASRQRREQEPQSQQQQQQQQQQQ